MSVRKKCEKRYVFIGILILFIILNLISGINGMLSHSAAFPDDFIMRYRESKYVLYRMNPLDVVLGICESLPEIGEMWDVAGYTPWEMALGIVTNFTFMPETAARWCFLGVYVLFMMINFCCLYRLMARERKRYALIFTLAVAAFPAWGTALSWLNFGAMLGMLVVWSVLLCDENEIAAGILLGLAAAKPQLALPFYLAYLLKRKYKLFFTACIVPLVLWGICAWLIGASPLKLVMQLSEVTGTLSGYLGSWLKYFGIGMSNRLYQMLCAVGGIALTCFFWYRLYRRGNQNNLFFFSIPAVTSGIWTYGQEHDRTVLVILVLCLLAVLVNDELKIRRKEIWVGIFVFAATINPEVWIAGGSMLYVLKVMKYLLLIGGIWFISSIEGVKADI